MKRVKIISEDVRPPHRKVVDAVLFDSELNEARRIKQEMQNGFDAQATIEANFDSLWLIASVVNIRDWLAREDDDLPDLYIDVAIAALEAARPAEATLAQVNTAMESVILASPRAGQWQKLLSLATSANAAQRERFYLLIGFLVLRDLLDSAK